MSSKGALSSAQVKAPDSAGMEINHYHSSMFQGENIHQAWIDDCARYLQRIFGDKIAGKTVVDYGFGRGNWSLAFRQLGAEHVISVEASQDAAENFKRYVKDHEIQNISVQLGNTDDQELHIEADIVFLYGILHHVKHPERLLGSARRWLKDEQSQILAYAYDAGSMREMLVSACRKLLGTEKSEPGWELALHPLARHRAVDDLVAPIVSFWTAKQLVDVANDAGLKPIGQEKDFSNFQNKSLAPEFDPYILLFKANTAQEETIEPMANSHQYMDEYKVIGEALELFVQHAPAQSKPNIAVGIFNSWFAGAQPASFEDKLFYLWRYLCHAINTIPQDLVFASTSDELETLLFLTRRMSHKKSDEFMRNCEMLKDKIKNNSFRI